MKASTSMTRDVIVVGPEFPMAAAWALLQARRIRHLPVVSGGRVLGILSDRDVLLRSTEGPDGAVAAPRSPVALAMSMCPVTCLPDARVSDLAAIMLERKIDAIPVVGRDEKLLGLVTSSDLLLLLVDDAPGRVLPFDFQLHDGERMSAFGA